MKSIVIHAPHDLRIQETQIEQMGADQVEIRLATGGVCGSDLHYYNHGGFGAIKLKEPMILGHEVSGTITKLGSSVSNLSVGQLVAVSPSRACNNCQYCHKGMQNHCLNMRFYGSAMPFPHIQGAFREVLIADASQCVVADGLSTGEAAMAEPLAVVLHAVKQAGSLTGKRVLVTGSGPIGNLCVLAARRAGAIEINVTDISDSALEFATKNGADRIINTLNNGEELAAFSANKGTFDVLFECSGAQPALVSAIEVMRPGAIIIQLGLGGDMSLPMMAITAKELQLRGSFRFHEEFANAVDYMRGGLIDVKPLITHTVGLTDAETAFKIASDRSTASMKTQISFT